MSATLDADIGPRPQEIIPPRRDRPSVGPGYDKLFEILRQSGRPLAFIMCLTAGFYQILAPPEAKLDDFSFGSFMVLLGGMCGIRAAELMQRR